MPFVSLPVEQRPYKRWAVLSPSDSTIHDPPTDAVMTPVVGGTTSFPITGADDVNVTFTIGQAQSATIFPLSVKKVPASSAVTLIGLWRD